jgi:hypothetical protein
MQYGKVHLIVKIKTYNFYMDCHVVYLKLIAVVDRKLLTSGTNLDEFNERNSIKFEFNSKFSQQCYVSMCSEMCHCVSL